MSSHVDTTVNDKFLIWMNEKYGKHAPMKATRGKVHKYLGMTFDFSKKGEVTVDMCKYMGKMWRDFAEKYELKSTAPTPATDELFKTDKSVKLEQEWKEDFHTYVARGLFASKRGRPDTCPTISVLSTRVREPNASDWGKLVRYMQFVKGSKDKKLRLSADNLHIIK